MKKGVLLLLAAVLLFISCEQQGEDYITKLTDKNKAYKSLHFKVNQKYYYSNGIDTIITPYEVWAVRDAVDTVWGGYVWADNNYRPYHMIYENGNFYLSIPPKKTTVLYKEFDEDFISPVDWIKVFLKTDKFQKILTDTLNKVTVQDVQYQNKTCKKLTVEFPEDAKGNIITYTYVLDEHYVPLWAMYKNKTDDYTYFDELTFSDYAFDKVNLVELKDKQKQVFADNPVEEGNDSETARLESMLHIGDDAPLFDGLHYGTQKSFKLSDFIGENVIIVDFWYTHCPPCVRAMPALSELNDEFKDKGLKIFGLNSVDNQPNLLPNLDKFLQKRKVSYDIIMTQSTVDLMYKIKGYPTMYVVDKTGKIAYVEIGFDEEKFADLKAKVEELLNE
jgi:thiol-disulfide isomerase/thioredoxin